MSEYFCKIFKKIFLTYFLQGYTGTKTKANNYTNKK